MDERMRERRIGELVRLRVEHLRATRAIDNLKKGMDPDEILAAETHFHGLHWPNLLPKSHNDH